MLHGIVLAACTAWGCRSDAAGWPNCGIQGSYTCFWGFQNWFQSGRALLPVRALQLKGALLKPRLIICSLWTQLILSLPWLCMDICITLCSNFSDAERAENIKKTWIYDGFSILIQVPCVVLCRVFDMVMMSPYALEAYRTPKTSKLGQDPHHLFHQEGCWRWSNHFPLFVPYVLGSWFVVKALCWSGHGLPVLLLLSVL